MTTWILHDKSRGRKREFDNRAEAQDKKQDLQSLGADSLSVYPKNESEDEDDGDEIATDGVEADVVDQTEEAKADGGSQVQEPPTQEEMEADPDIITGPEDLEQESTGGYDLPDKPPVDEDPIAWMPQDFTDNIEGKTAINRKGYEVMARHYGIGTPDSDCIVGPEETDYTFCRVKATAETEDGTVYTAHGSAHVDRGDDPFLLLEMADTRARKRVLAQATGVGMVAVEELMNGVSGQ